MVRKTIARIAVALTLVAAGAALTLAAGPLNPPAGPVTSNYKTLTEVEPRTAVSATNTPGDATSLFKITQPGSYYLTGNITGVPGKHGIAITASGVTLDLNGFDLVGVAGMGSFDGVSVTVANLRNITLLNGSIRNWGRQGASLANLSLNCRVEGVRVSDNSGVGILTGDSATISNCLASFNASDGIQTDKGCTLLSCSAKSNAGHGFELAVGCSISNCSASSNSGNGFITSNGSAISDCTASNNTGNGITAGAGSTVSNCVSSFNIAAGLTTGVGCTVVACTLQFNSSDGLTLGDESSASGCTCSLNSGDGIEIFNNCTLSHNTSYRNGTAANLGAGVRISGSRNVVDGNTLHTNQFGITVPGTRNLIVHNHCTLNNVNYDIGASNNYGPIIDRSSLFGPAVSGNTAASSLGSTDPNANFTY